MHDLAWGRLEFWRAATAAAFAPLERRALLPRITHLDVRYNGDALAAGLLIAVGVYRTSQPVPEPVYREVHHAGMRSLLPEGQALPREAAVLRWSPLEGAVSYDVQVSTEDLRTVATAKGQPTTAYRIPASALAGLPSGARLLWQVDAVRPDGTHENSPTFITPLK